MEIDDRKATAISFPGETLSLLKRVAARENRSLAGLIRLICESWLRSPEGLAAIRRTAEKKFDVRALEQSAIMKDEKS